jgi:serine/threonine protein kinase
VTGNYELVERIGIGGMGEVWRARHKSLGRDAAVKLIRADALGAESNDKADRTLRRFEKEARATAGLRSPHTVELYDFGITDDGTFYYAMELLEGLDLQSLVKRFGPIPPGRAVHLLRQVCESLAEAHQQGLIHRDIKPANVFCCRLGVRFDFAKVLDFGLVKSAQGEGEDSDLTVDGAVPGSPAFMSPEAIRGVRDLDARTDLYSLGCVAYWLVTGHKVFEGQTALDLVLAHLQSDPEAPSGRLDAPLPPALEAVIMACLAKDPADRPADAMAVSRALAACEEAWTEEDAEAWWSSHDLDVEVDELEDSQPDLPATLTADFEELSPTPDAGSFSDLTQEGVVAQLQQQFDASRIDVYEFDRRSQLAQLARGEDDLRAALEGLAVEEKPALPLVRALQDIPAIHQEAELPVPAKDVDRWTNLVSVFSGANRKGAWRSPSRIRCIDVFGGTDLDFRFARMRPGMTEVRCYNVFGGTTIVIPPDLYVEVEGFGVFGGFGQTATDTDRPEDDTPWLRVTGLAVFGGTDVKIKPREKTGLKKLLSFLGD